LISDEGIFECFLIPPAIEIKKATISGSINSDKFRVFPRELVHQI
jgi:hypothetical protein